MRDHIFIFPHFPCEGCGVFYPECKATHILCHACTKDLTRHIDAQAADRTRELEIIADHMEAEIRKADLVYSHDREVAHVHD